MPISQHANTTDGSTATHAPSAMEGSLSFRELYMDHVAFVWRSLRRLGVRERDVEDAAQETFIVAHRKLASFDGASPRGWLFNICLRVAADHRKRAHVRREEPTDATPDASVPADQTDDLARRRDRELLQSILDELDEPRRAVVVLYELEELPMPEVASILDCPLQTAYSRLHAARKQMQDALRRAGRGRVSS